MKKFFNKKIILIVISILIILAGVIVGCFKGVEKSIEYKSGTRIEVYIPKGYNKEDIINIAKESFGNIEMLFSEIETLNQVAGIKVEEYSKEQIDIYISKIAEKYEMDKEKIEYHESLVPETKVITVMKPYILPVIIITVLSLIYIIIKNYKFDKKIKMICRILGILVMTLLVYFSIILKDGGKMEKLFKSLTEAIKNHNQIILMAHKNIDLDALGSLLCLYEITTTLKKETYIIMNEEVNNSVSKALSKLQNINFKYNTNEIEENALLIIVDTHKKELVEQETLLLKIKDIVVIDHHIKDPNYIKNTIFSYINSNLSSTAEIMLHYSKYLNYELSSITATIMLAGIEIDTNSYSLKTTDKTYETAALLLKIGADNLLKQELLKENKEEYLKRQKILENAHMITDKIALCIFDTDKNQKEEIALTAADLLQFDNVEIGFAIGKLKNGNIGISAKSLGNNNVKIIMNQLGGGGHMNNAASELKDVTIEEAKEKLLKIIKE